MASPGCSRHPRPTHSGREPRGEAAGGLLALWGLGVSLRGAAGPKFHVLPLGAAKQQKTNAGRRHLLLSLTPDPSLRSSPQPFSLSPSVCRAIKGTSSRRPSFGPVSRLARASHHFQQELKTRHPNRPFLNIARPPTPPDQGWTGQDLLLQTAQTKAPKRAEVLPSRDGLGLGHLRWKCLAKQCLLSSQ